MTPDSSNATAPLDVLALALNLAIYRDLPALLHVVPPPPDIAPVGASSIVQSPVQHLGVETTLFPQQWESSGLGFNSLTAPYPTRAYTVVVECRHSGHRAVYFHRWAAYLVPPANSQTEAQRDNWQQDMATKALARCIDAPERYGATLFEGA